MFIYYCENCNEFKAFQSQKGNFKCPGCGKEFLALDVSIDDWNQLSNEEMLQAINKAKEPTVYIKKPDFIDADTEKTKSSEEDSSSLSRPEHKKQTLDTNFSPEKTQNRQKQKRKTPNKKWTIIIISVILACLIVAGIVALLFRPKIKIYLAKNTIYKKAIQAYNENNIVYAINELEKLKDFRDVSEKLPQWYYELAEQCYNEGKYSGAMYYYNKAAMEKYGDADEKAQKLKPVLYQMAEEALDKKDYFAATDYYNSAGDYENARENYKLLDLYDRMYNGDERIDIDSDMEKLLENSKNCKAYDVIAKCSIMNNINKLQGTWTSSDSDNKITIYPFRYESVWGNGDPLDLNLVVVKGELYLSYGENVRSKITGINGSLFTEQYWENVSSTGETTNTHTWQKR